MKPITMYCVIAENDFSMEELGESHLHLYPTSHDAANAEILGHVVLECTFKPIGKVGIVPLAETVLAPDVPSIAIPEGGTPGIFKGAVSGDLFKRNDGKTAPFDEGTGDGYFYMHAIIGDDYAGAKIAERGIWSHTEAGLFRGEEHNLSFPYHIISRA